eukprot:4800133-Prorocentrum_lima.AAC.1
MKEVGSKLACVRPQGQTSADLRMGQDEALEYFIYMEVELIAGRTSKTFFNPVSPARGIGTCRTTECRPKNGISNG